jgi:hypothetical protein
MASTFRVLNKPSKKPVWKQVASTAHYFHAGFLLSLFINPEDGGNLFSETSIHFQWTTWCYIPEDSTLHNHRCENLKSYKVAIYSSEMLVSTYQTAQQHNTVISITQEFWTFM